MILIIICFINRFHAQNCSENENSGCDLGIGLDKMMKNCVSIRPPRDVDVLAVLDFLLGSFRIPRLWKLGIFIISASS